MSVTSNMRHNNIQDTDLRQTVAVIAQATEANERQIREVSRASAEQFKDVSTLIEKTNAQTNIKLETLATSFQASQKPNVMAWIGAITVALTMIAGAMYIISLSTENTVYRNTIPIQAALDANTSGDKVSTSERATHAAAILELQKNNAGHDTEEQVILSRLGEMETQMKKNYSDRNIQFSQIQRTLIEHQSALHDLGATIPLAPQAPYYQPEAVEPPH